MDQLKKKDIKKLIQIGSLVTGITIFAENMCSILYNVNLLKKSYGQYRKKFIRKTVLFLDFTSHNQILSKLIHWVKNGKG